MSAVEHVITGFEIAFAVGAALALAALVCGALQYVGRRALLGLALVEAAASAAAWIVFALHPHRDELAVTAAGLLVSAGAAAAAAVLSRAVARERRVEQEIARAEQRLADQIQAEAEERGRELERTLARARADSVSLLQDEERRIAENHRGLVAEREHASGVKLVAALAETQQKVEQRLVEWRQDLDRTMARLQQELGRVGGRQRELIGEAEARIAIDAERIAAESDEQRAAIARLREDLERTTRDALAAAAAELESHAQERRRVLEELADRLRRRELTIADHIEHEEADAVQRIQMGFAEVERRQVEALERSVERSSARFAEATSQLFADDIKAAREQAAQRLARELDRAVQAFLREAESVLRERVEQVGETGAQRLEKRLSQLASTLERQRDDALAALERKVEEAEASFRRNLETLAADAEAERGIVEARLHELSRRIEETLAHAQERIGSL
jgi:colicin import membrane protein